MVSSSGEMSSTTYWMSPGHRGESGCGRIRGCRDRRVAGDTFAAWQVQLARAKWLGLPAPTRSTHD